jgi:glucose/arabinose dehydrogenase
MPTPAESEELTSGTRSRRWFLGTVTAAAMGLAGCSTEEQRETETSTDGDATVTVTGETGSTTGTSTTSTSTASTSTPTPVDYDATVEHDVENWAEYDPEWTPPATSPLDGDFEVEVLVENLEIPWDLSFAPDGTLFITERVGRVLAFEDGTVRRVAEPAEAIDAGSVEPGSDESSWFVKGGEGGTLGVAAHPTYPDPPLVYVYYSYDTDAGRYNRVDYFDLSAEESGERYGTIVEGIPANNIHNGGRITFGPENYLWITTGDSGRGKLAQDLTRLGGKALRVTPEGEPAPGNPNLGDDADARIYTYGHRNPQGIAWLPDGTPVVSEHGASGQDEINRLEAGGNYGWPDVRKREEYLDSSVHRPVVNTGGNTWAPTGSVFYTGDRVPSLSNRLLTGALSSQQLVITTMAAAARDPLPGGEEWPLFDQEWTDTDYQASVFTTFEDRLGRIRHVEQGPDGGLYAITSNRDGRASGEFPTDRDDVLVRIVPA